MKKLRHKITREIAVFAGVEIKDDRVFFRFEDERGIFKMKINSLDELKEWEDYKEPKEYWYIDCYGDVQAMCNEPKDFIVCRQLIGNYFETREEAEQAVEKLKAWKRLKDKEFEFVGFSHIGANGWIKGEIKFLLPSDTFGDGEKELDLLFGDEE